MEINKRKNSPVAQMIGINDDSIDDIVNIIEKREKKTATIYFKTYPSLKKKLDKKSRLLNVSASEILTKLLELYTDDI